MWRCTHSRVTTRSTNTPLGRGQRTQDRHVKTKTASEMCLINTGSNLCGAKRFLNCACSYLFHVRPGHDGISQISVWLVSLQVGPPSVSWQSRVLFLWPCPHEVEQELHGLQGSYTGQGSLVHTRVPFSHTLQIEGCLKNLDKVWAHVKQKRTDLSSVKYESCSSSKFPLKYYRPICSVSSNSWFWLFTSENETDTKPLSPGVTVHGKLIFWEELQRPVAWWDTTATLCHWHTVAILQQLSPWTPTT